MLRVCLPPLDARRGAARSVFRCSVAANRNRACTALSSRVQVEEKSPGLEIWSTRKQGWSVDTLRFLLCTPTISLYLSPVFKTIMGLVVSGSCLMWTFDEIILCAAYIQVLDHLVDHHLERKGCILTDERKLGSIGSGLAMSTKHLCVRALNST